MNLEKQTFNDIKTILYSARNSVYKVANNTMVKAYFEIGKVIVEKQGGNDRAGYGESLIKHLSVELTAEFGKGFTTTNLKNMRTFYLTFQKGHALRDELSWTHYRLLMRVENENARMFYEDECVKSNWSTRQLERQINSFFYEGLLFSSDKETVKNEIYKLETQSKTPKDIIRDPYVLEFSGLPDQHSFASKYKLYLPSEEELKAELNKEIGLLSQEKELCDGEKN